MEGVELATADRGFRYPPGAIPRIVKPRKPMKTLANLRVIVSAALLLGVVPLGNAAAPASSAQHYAQDGLAFDYAPGLKVETEKKDATVTVNLKGSSDLVLTIQVADLPLAGEAYAESVVEGMRKGMKNGGAKVEKLETLKAEIGKHERQGKGFKYSLLGAALFYQAYGWDVSRDGPNRRILFVAIQYPPKKESAVKPLIEPTLKSLQYQKP
jgi:hypothetical protein